MITISRHREFNALTKKAMDSLYLRVYLEAFESGLVAKMKPTDFTVFLAICSYMNENGTCYPTQQQLAKRCGISKTTVNSSVKSLLDFRLEGQPILFRKFAKTGNKLNSVYTINPLSQVAIFNSDTQTVLPEIIEVPEEQQQSILEQELNEENPAPTKEKKPKQSFALDDNSQVKFHTAKDVIAYFCEVYRNTYNVSPSVNYGQLTRLLNTKWKQQYTHEQIYLMVTLSVQEYEKKWASAKFPRPTLSAIISWVGLQAMGGQVAQEKEYQENTALTQNSDNMNQLALNRLTGMINK